MNTPRPRTPNILLVEDDDALAAMLSDTLRARSYGVWHARSAADAEAALDELLPDLILLDLMLPDRSGLIMCAGLKARAGAPVIICSATTRKDDAAIGFQLGADDFLRKPFSVDELQERIELSLRRGPVSGGDGRRLGDQLERVGALSIDKSQCVARVGNAELQLTPTEFRLLSAVAARAGQVVSRQELAAHVWTCVDEGVLRSLDVHMRRLRAKLARTDEPGPRLIARRGFGFQLSEPTSASSAA